MARPKKNKLEQPVLTVHIPEGFKEGDIVPAHLLQENGENFAVDIEKEEAPMPELSEKPLPPVTLEYIHNAYRPPRSTVKHAFQLMKVGALVEELAISLYYACPHNVHLQQALLELQLVQEAANKAVLSE